MSLIIQSVLNPELFLYEVDVVGVTEAELQAFCNATRNTKDNFKSSTGQLYVPSLLLAGLTVNVIQLINEKYDGSCLEKKKFPIKKTRGCPPGNNSGTQGNRIYLNENFTVKIQVLTETRAHKEDHLVSLLCRVEIFKLNEIAFGGLLTFTGEKHAT